MSTSEDIVIVESSDYAQVIFDDVNETYPTTKTLECAFTLNEMLTTEGSTEWVGIYKVGFSNCDEYFCYLPVEATQENKGKVTFPTEVLPKEDGEFYQFVYVSNAKQIRGASVPFQFKLEECCGYSDEEDQDAVVVKFESNDTITEIKNRCVQLSNTNQTYEKLIRENESIIKSLKDEVASIKLRCFRLTMDNEKLNFTLRSKADSLKNLADTISSLTSDNNSLQTKFNDLSSDNQNLLLSLQERISQVASLKEELESAKIDQIHKLEHQVVERTEELNQIKCDLRKNNVIVTEQAETIQTILGEKENLNFLIKKLTNELETTQQNMTQELAMSKDKLSAAEQCKEMLRNQLSAVSDELEESKNKISVQANVAHELTERLAQIEFEKASSDAKLSQMKLEHEEKMNQVNGSYYVLRVAHNSLETRLKSSEQRRDLIEKDYEVQKKTIGELKQENDELKERIRYGAKEYTKLFEKCRFLKNQRFNSEMNVYHDLNQEESQLTRRRQHFNSTQSEDKDSAIQDKTASQNARASANDSENTLLDALMGTSFYNGTWSGNNQQSASINSSKQRNSSTATPTTTTQPKSSQNQASDLSDDGLIGSASTQLDKLNPFQQSTISQQKDQNCEICDFIFPTGANQEEREQHYTSHYGPSCPVCFLQFRKGYAQQDLENHVNSHFTN